MFVAGEINPMSLLRLRISGRLYASFGALVLFGLALAGFAVWQLQAVDSQVDKMMALNDNVVRVLTVTADLQAMRRAILRYAFDHDKPSYEEADKRGASAIAVLQDAAKATLSEERRKTYGEVEQIVRELRAKRNELGEAVDKSVAGKAILFPVGDKMAADVAKLVEAADKTESAHLAVAVERDVLLVRVANWRFLATKDPNGQATFKSNVEKTQKSIAALEAGDPPQSVRALVAAVKSSVAEYAKAFEQTAPNITAADQAYYKGVTPLTVSAVEKLATAEESLQKGLHETKAETAGVISGTIRLQQIVAGLALLIGSLIAFVIA